MHEATLSALPKVLAERIKKSKGQPWRVRFYHEDMVLEVVTRATQILKRFAGLEEKDGLEYLLWLLAHAKKSGGEFILREDDDGSRQTTYVTCNEYNITGASGDKTLYRFQMSMEH